MREALLKYDFTDNGLNIGDYIQSLAVKQFLSNQDPILISREALNEYEGEQVKLIMNGWFFNERRKFSAFRKNNAFIGFASYQYFCSFTF